MFCDCITLGGRMLLDIGPKEDGTLDERQAKVLLDLGGWIHDHEEAVFGTEKGCLLYTSLHYPDAGSVCCGISAVLGYHFIHQCAKRRIEW